MEEIKNKSFTPPWLFKREGGHHQFKMVIPGITYQLFLGKVMPSALRAMCTARSPNGLIYMSARTDEINLEGTLKMLKNSRRVGKLAKSDRAILSDDPLSDASCLMFELPAVRIRRRVDSGDARVRQIAANCGCSAS